MSQVGLDDLYGSESHMLDAWIMTPPPQMPCSAEHCEYMTPANIPTYELVIKALEIHQNTVHSTRPDAAPKTEKPKRPTVTTGMSEAEWEFFIHRWERYTRQTKLSGPTLIDELWATLDIDLERLAFHDNLNASSQEELLASIKRLAVTVLHPSLHIVALHDMKQGENESTKMFSARVKGVANNCELKKKCTKAGCREMISFVDETCYHVVLAGLNDADLREKVLTQAMLGTVKDLATLLSYTTAEESAKIKHPPQEIGQVQHQQTRRAGKCQWCGSNQHGDKNSNRQSQCRAYGQQCTKCKKYNHFAAVCKQRTNNPAVNEVQIEAEDDETEGDVSGFIASLSTYPLKNPTDASPLLAALRDKSKGNWNTVPIPHFVYNTRKNEWTKQAPKPPPVLQVSLALDRAAYKELGVNMPELVRKTGAGHSRARNATTDTGAQLTVISLAELNALGAKRESIFPLSTVVNTVTKSSVDIIGGIFLRITAYDERSSTVRSTRQLCYVSTTIRGIYLSEDACLALGCIPASFPTIGDCAPIETPSPGKCENTGVGSSVSCHCPKRAMPPADKPELPCQPTVENLPRLKEYILNRYAASGFNCCENQPLPLMDSAPPLRLFVDPQATPVAAFSPSAIPIHWNAAVKEGLDRDVKLGVIEQVPVNEPAKWCCRMVVTPKSDGSPRRVVDFGPVNRNAPRQPHHTKSPYTIAMSVPGNTVKTVLDNWHGYHSVPIHPEDKHLTTFITPYGRYRYKTTPQGFISAGDGYTHRMDLIVEGVKDFEHCVDDSILWDSDIETNFFRVCDFIERCSKAGCIFNPEKFQFGSETVEFLGFQITKSGIQPTPKFIKKIMDFPTPASLTDVRSWFGLINQVSYAFAMAEHMAPFRGLLSSKIPFAWSQELETAFNLSKHEIVKQCSKGVRCFTPNAPTALATDWSKNAVGCWLSQKFCTCKAEIPGCCVSGWQTVFISSKFNSPAVSRYHPIEGEAFAATWALEKCKMFVLGHPDLTLVVDHKPLLAILGPDQDLSELANPRLMNLKLKTNAYKFTPRYLPGKLHVVPDTMSRRSDSPVGQYPQLPKAPPVANNVGPGYSDSFGPPKWISPPNTEVDGDELFVGHIIAVTAGLSSYGADIAAVGPAHPVLTWEKLLEACRTCPNYRKLWSAVTSGFPLNRDDWPDSIKPFHKVHKDLTAVEDIVMLQNRIVVPESCRQQVLSHLHASHSGTKGMLQRALMDVYWPDYATDIIRYRERCVSCNLNAPSNPRMLPSQDIKIPDYPFQVICMDFFTVQNKNFLVIVDKYSGWLSLFQLQKDTSANVIKALREYFATFGVCETACSDGARVFTSEDIKAFCKNWGICQRISSAYHPTSNKRAELGVKSAKRLVRENLGPNGSINSDKMAKALLAHRNTPDAESKTSPAMIVYGRPVRDHIPKRHYTPNAVWSDLAEKREQCFLKRHYLQAERWEKGAKNLKALEIGDNVYVQEQHGSHPKKWSKSGIVVEITGHDSYLIKLDGSGKLTRRNRQFLRKFQPFKQTIVDPSTSLSSPGDEQTAPVNLLQQILDNPLQYIAVLHGMN